MADATHDINELKRRMQASIGVLKTELSGLRTGRASPHMLDPVHVDAYGAQMPLNQVATVSIPEPRLIAVNVWIPELNEERRKELVKLAHKYAEAAKVAVRHVRRDGIDIVKKLEKDHKISKDDHERFESEIQKLTDQSIVEVDHVLAGKEKEILTV